MSPPPLVISRCSCDRSERVTPEEEGVQGTPDLVVILRGRVLLHMLPCRGGIVLGIEDGPNLLRVSEEG